MATIYYTRALTRLPQTHPELNNCFVFAIASGSTFKNGETALYVFSPLQDSGNLLALLQALPANTLQRHSLSNYSFQSLVRDVQSFAGAYDLSQIGPYPPGVHIGLRSRATGRREPRGPFTFPSWDQLIQAILQFLENLRLDQTINLAVMPGDIGNATSLSGWVARIDNAPSWMLSQIQVDPPNP